MKRIAIIIGAIILLAAAGFLVTRAQGVAPSPPDASAAATSTATSAPYVVPALTKSYTNSAYRFALMLPSDFTVQDTSDPTSGNTTLVLQSADGDGIQVVISPWTEDTTGSYTLTKARILQDLPDLTITDEQPVVVGPNYTGLAFRSDNKAFNGDSREVWFVFRGHLYQISTYARLDPLLKAIFATWQFN